MDNVASGSYQLPATDRLLADIGTGEISIAGPL